MKTIVTELPITVKKYMVARHGACAKAPLKTIKVGNNIFVTHVVKTMFGRVFNLTEKGFNVGGYAFNKERLERILGVLKGTDNKSNGLVTKPHVKTKKKFQVEIVDESENFYISKSGKTYAKADYEYATVKSSTRIAHLYVYSYSSYRYAETDKKWHFGDLDTGYKKQDTAKLIELVEYMYDVLTIIENDKTLQIKNGTFSSDITED